jgi:rhamnulokinase
MSNTTSARGTASRRVVAVDLGAESCRISLLRWDGSSSTLDTLHRFPNHPVERDGHLCWDLERICSGVEEGLAICARKAAGAIDSIGVDGWAVDYVWLNSQSVPLRSPFCYRDPRTERSQLELWKQIPPERLYALTGIQMMRFNTLYQLFADQRDQLPTGVVWLNLPEYLLHRLGGQAVSEYTNATHTQMVKAGSMEWCGEIMDAAGLDVRAAPRIVPPGSVLGTVQGRLAELPEFRSTKLIAPACHDTGSAVAGIPDEGDDWAFISSGTWSLVGTVLPQACTTDAAYRHNFSNEGGLGGTVRFLKNVNGMWLIEECLRAWREERAEWDLAALIGACRTLDAPRDLLAVDDPELLLSDRMPDRINSVLRKHGYQEISTHPSMAPQFANLIFHSLAHRYAEILQQVTEIHAKPLRRLFVVGGGSRNVYLNDLIRKRCGIELLRGPAESSTIGNAAVQMAVLDGNIEPNWGVRPDSVARWSRAIAAPAAA